MQTYCEVIHIKKPVPQDAKFSILIPSWNNLPYLQLCIKSILKNYSFPHQIIVHINEGADGTRESLEHKEGISYTSSKQIIGFWYALNDAASVAETELITYINDDMYVSPGGDQALLEEINQLPHRN